MTAPSQAMVETTVDVRHVTVRYGRKVAVDGVSFAIPQGAVFALLGRNGAGKSSLVRCLLGQFPACHYERAIHRAPPPSPPPWR